MHRFYSSSIDYDTELQSSLFGSKSTAQLVKFRFLLGEGGAALPIVRRCPVGYVNPQVPFLGIVLLSPVLTMYTF